MTTQFGIHEMHDFATMHDDARVRVLYRRLEEARRKNAMWCSAEANTRQILQNLVNYIDSTGDESLVKSHAYRNAYSLIYGAMPE